MTRLPIASLSGCTHATSFPMWCFWLHCLLPLVHHTTLKYSKLKGLHSPSAAGQEA